MFITGHLAASTLAARRWDLDLRFALAAALFPDVVDKTCRYLLGIVPSGRIPSHTLLMVGLTTAAVALWGRRRGRVRPWVTAWLVGYGLHLACDVASQVPLLWPFRAYVWRLRPWPSFLHGPLSPGDKVTLAVEGLLVAAAVGVEVRRWRGRSRGPVPT